MNGRLPYLFDSLLSKLLLFFLGLVLGGYYCPSFSLAVLFGAVFSLCLSGVYLSFVGLNEKKSAPSNEKYRSFFYELSRDERLAFFRSAIEKRRTVTDYDGFFVVSEYALFCALRYAPLSPDEVVECAAKAKRTGAKSAVILCFEADARCDEAASLQAVKTRVLKEKEAIKLIRALGLDERIPKLCVKRRHMHTLLSAALSRSRARGYFFGALIMLSLSGITAFSHFYLFFGCALLALALVSRLKKV